MEPLPAERLDHLISELRSHFGEDAVDCSAASQFAYGRDLWPQLTLQVRDGRGPLVKPDVILRPDSEEQVVTMLQVCSRHRVPIVPFGSGSGVCGGSAPTQAGVVIDLKGLCDFSEPDGQALQVTCGPGLITQDLEQRLNDRGFTLGHFPSSIFCASIGGCVAARGAGQLSSHYGKIEDMVTGLRVATPGLGLISTGSLDTSDTEPDWTPMFVGSEGTLGLITALRLRIRPLPETVALRGLRFPTLEAALQCFRAILQSGLRPSAMRIYDPLDTWMAMNKSNDSGGDAPRPGGGTPMDEATHSPSSSVDPEEPEGWLSSLGPLTTLRQRRGGFGLRKRISDLMKPENLPIYRVLGSPGRLNRALNLLPERCLAIIGCEGEESLAREQLDAVLALAASYGAEDLGPDPGERWFRTRHHVSFKLPKLLAQGAFADTMEIAAPWSRVHDLYDAVRAAVSPHVLIMAHLSHAYHEGCSIYFTMVGHGRSPEEAERTYQNAWKAALEATVACDATITHHHGVGVLKKEFMNLEHRAARQLYEAARKAVDPEHNLNVGKLFPAELPAPEPASDEPDAYLLKTGAVNDGIVEVGMGWNGADLVAELNKQGAFLAPLGRDFLEGTVQDWLASPAIAAHHAMHGAWEHPLVAVSGLLPGGQYWRSGALPRSAAGPSYLPFAIGAARLPTRARTASFRVHRNIQLRYFGFRFEDLTKAQSAVAEALRGAARPVAGILFGADEAGGFRSLKPIPGRRSTPGFIFLVMAESPGHPQAAEHIAKRLQRAGGTTVLEDYVLSWWQQHWGRACRDGKASLPTTALKLEGRVIGSCSATVSWARAGLLLRAVETLTGGPHRAVGWQEAPLESGCTVRLLFTASRKGASGTPLLIHQLRATLRSYGARLSHMHFESDEPVPDYLVGGRGTVELEESDSALMTRRVADNLLAEFGSESSW